MLTPAEARAFYDRFGRRQDAQAFYEDAALDDLVAHAAFERAGSVFELGCGTGRFAARLLGRHLPASATYVGMDISSTMVGIAGERLAPYAARARVSLCEADTSFPLPDHSVERVVSTYVLDLLSDGDISRAISEARRVLVPAGKLCLVSLTKGEALVPRLVSALWSALFRLRPSWLGGCRPIRLEPFLDSRQWSIEYRRVVRQFGVPSEVLVAKFAAHG